MLGHVLLIRFKLDADHRAIAAVQAAFLASLVNFLLGQGAVAVVPASANDITRR